MRIRDSNAWQELSARQRDRLTADTVEENEVRLQQMSAYQRSVTDWMRSRSTSHSSCAGPAVSPPHSCAHPELSRQLPPFLTTRSEYSHSRPSCAGPGISAVYIIYNIIYIQSFVKGESTLQRICATIVIAVVEREARLRRMDAMIDWNL